MICHHYGSCGCELGDCCLYCQRPCCKYDVPAASRVANPLPVAPVKVRRVSVASIDRSHRCGVVCWRWGCQKGAA